MGTLVSEIVVQAFREGNYTAVGESTTAEEMAEAVPRLRNLLSSLLGIELGEQYRDWYVPQEHNPAAPLRYPLTPTGTGETSSEPWAYPPANSRLVVKITDAKTVYFPAYPNDGARMALIDTGSTGAITLHGNGRLIEGVASMTAGGPVTQYSGRKWLYRADLANWIRIDQPLTSASELPLPEEFDDLLVTGLAIRLAPRFQVKVDEVIGARFEDMLGRLKKRYKQSEKMPSAQELRQVFRSEGI
jgi:hypothetical protein